MDNKKKIGNSKRANREEIFLPFVVRSGMKEGDSHAFFVTEDGRKVNFLENPVKMPTKSGQDRHFNIDELITESSLFVINEENSKEMDLIDGTLSFDRSSCSEDIDEKNWNQYSGKDFDIEVDDEDDFDV